MNDSEDWRSKSDDFWRAKLDPEAFKVLRKKGTERAFSGALSDLKETGDYLCGACGQRVFSSVHKFESGTGWPSFWEAAEPGSLELRSDRSFFMRRTEVCCSRCGSHLGHVFDDGPEPTGKRYCINSIALNFSKNPSLK